MRDNKQPIGKQHTDNQYKQPGGHKLQRFKERERGRNRKGKKRVNETKINVLMLFYFILYSIFYLFILIVLKKRTTIV